jgi:hypothetical protein
METGLRKKVEILRILEEEGFKIPTGKPPTAQTLDKVLRNPLYAGWVTLPSDPSAEPSRGLHEPLITQETFDRVQAILDGKKSPPSPKAAYQSRISTAAPCAVRSMWHTVDRCLLQGPQKGGIPATGVVRKDAGQFRYPSPI